MKIAVVGNGEWDVDWGRAELADADYLICADGGANAALNSNRWPDLVIGDLDSLTTANYERLKSAGVRMERYPREKNETDLELALACAAEKAVEAGGPDIWLYGATGLRVDHFLGNLALLLYYASRRQKIRVRDPQQEMEVIWGADQVCGCPGQEISLLPLSERALVSTEGLYYSLDKEYLYQASPRGISNILIGERALIKVHEGLVLLIKNQSASRYD